MQIEAIKSEQQRILKELYLFKDFYLVGGTALALQIGHRVSIDFDLFTEKCLPPNLLSRVKKIFPKAKIAIILKHLEQFSVTVDGIKIDFVKEQPLLLDPVVFQNLKIASVAEIAAMKAHTLGFRGKLKDYVDLYFILKNKITDLQSIGDLAERKYGAEFNFRLFLEQLTYMEDIEAVDIEFLREKIDKTGLQKFFQEEVKKIKI